MGQTTGGKEKQLARQPLLTNAAEHLLLTLISMRQSSTPADGEGAVGVCSVLLLQGWGGGDGTGSRHPRLSPGTKQTHWYSPDSTRTGRFRSGVLFPSR